MNIKCIMKSYCVYKYCPRTILFLDRLKEVCLVMLQELTMGAGITDEVIACLKKCLSHPRT